MTKYKWVKEVEIKKKLEIDAPDHYALKAPDGTIYNLTVDNNGVFHVTELHVREMAMMKS